MESAATSAGGLVDVDEVASQRGAADGVHHEHVEYRRLVLLLKVVIGLL